MSIIYSYPEETSLQGSDMLIGTSTALVGGKQKNITKNFTLDQLSSFIQGGEGVINPAASDFQIAVFNQSGAKLTGSIMSQDVYPNGTGITISGNLSTTGNLVAPGTVTLGGGSNLIDLTSTTKLSGPVIDSIGNAGTLNQILLVNNEGKLIWGNYTSGLTYQGLWDADQNDPVLGSSIGTNSTFYIVGTAGNFPLNGNTDWQVGDWAIFVGTTGAGGIWQKIDNTSSITGNGTVNRMVMWSSNFTVTDGPLLDSSGTNVLSILDRSIIPSVSNTRSLGSSSLKWNMLYINDIETTNINILSHVDLNSLPGTPGQVLTSSGAGEPAVWTTPTTGTITGAGTTNKIPLWTNNVAIGDSILTQLNAATPFTDTYLSVGSGGVSTTGLKVDGFFVDSTGSKGAAGQILSSTGTATLWKTGDDEGVTYTLSAGAQDGTSVPINLIDSLSVTTPVKLTGGTNVDVVRTSATEITLSSTNTTYDFGSSTSGSDVLLNLVGTPADNSSVKLIGSGVTIAQAADEVTFTVPAGDTYELNAGDKSGTSVPLNLTSGSGADNSVVNLTEGTGITLTQTSATEITIAGVAQGVTGSGTVNKLSKFDTTTSLTDSIVSEVSGVSLTKASAFRVDGTINFAGLGTCAAAGGGSEYCNMDDVATVDLSTDPFGFIANDGKVSFIGFNFSNSTEADAFRSLYGVSAPAGPLPPCSDGGGNIANSVNVTVNFNNSATITFNVPSGSIGFNCGNDIGFGVYKLGLNPSIEGQAITYVSGSGSISNGDATVSDVKVSIAGKLDMSTNQIKNVVDPTDAQDAATKAYVDSSNVGSITGSGTVNKLPKFGTTDSLTDSLISETVSGIKIAGELDMSDNKIVNVTNPTDAQDAATKSYVDTVVTGQLVFEGDYDATTAPPFGPSVLQGYTYVVTVAGDYGGLWPIPLAVGDLIISNQDNPVDVGDYTEVNKQVDIASETTLGIANFPTGNSGLNVTNGAVTAKLFSGTLPGYVPDASTADAGTFLKEDGTWAVAGVGSVTNFSTVSTAYPGITTTVTNPTSTPELVLGLGANAAAGKYLDGGTGDWVTLPPPGTGTVTGTGTASQVTFWDGTSNINGDADFNWDNTSKRLGIGTSIPGYSIDIDSDSSTAIPTIQIQDSLSSMYLRLSSDSNSSSSKIEFSSDLNFFSGASMLMNMTSIGHIGIGTDTFQYPITRLHIRDRYSTSILTLESDFDTQRTDYYNGSTFSTYASFGTQTGDFTMDLQYSGNNTTLFNFTKDGRLGIGPYVVPNYALDVQEGSSTGFDAVINVQSQNSSNQLQIGAGVNFGSTNYIDSNVALQIKKGSTNVMFIDYDTMAFEPRVGINTTTPLVSFEIATQDAIKIPVGSNTDRSYITASNGMLRYNSDALEFEGYSNGAWGAIGGGGASATITSNQTTTTNATTTVFALGATPNGSSVNFVDAFVDGVYQETTTYSVSGQNLTFNSPIPSGVTVETKTTSDYNVGAAVQTVNGLTGNVSTKDIPVVKTNSTPEAVTTQNQHLYVLYGSAAVTLTLPSSPSAGDYIKISNLSTLTTNVVAQAASGERIMGTAANLTLDNATASFQLIYSGVSDPGWVVVGPA